MGDIAEDITKKDLLWHLQGNWAPVDKELSELNLEVKGENSKRAKWACS